MKNGTWFSTSDLKEGKKTLFIIDAFNKCNDEERERINLILGKENLPDDQYDFIRNVVNKYESKNYALSMIEKYAKDGEIMLTNFNANSEFSFDSIPYNRKISFEMGKGHANEIRKISWFI